MIICISKKIKYFYKEFFRLSCFFILFHIFIPIFFHYCLLNLQQKNFYFYFTLIYINVLKKGRNAPIAYLHNFFFFLQYPLIMQLNFLCFFVYFLYALLPLSTLLKSLNLASIPFFRCLL